MRVGRLLALKENCVVKGSGCAACPANVEQCAIPVLLFISQDESTGSKKEHPMVDNNCLLPLRERSDFRKRGNIDVVVGKVGLPNIIYPPRHRPHHWSMTL